MNRRDFIRNAGLATIAIKPVAHALGGTDAAEKSIDILNPLGKVPVSFIIDDSTALVNMAYYGIPQFAEVFPDNYKQEWRKLPREIPDSFVAEFIAWCDSKGVKGKYSMVPYPACTGWLHRFIPGWTRNELKNSLDLVRDKISVNWDIHPEMISHTRVINLKTGLPYPDPTPEFMENWEWSQDKSADELTSYISYALNVLKEAGFYCEGVTTPGGFCHRNIPNLATATMEAVGHHYNANVAHFFRDVITDKNESVAPVVVDKKNIDSTDPSCSVHIIGCTGDWFGGWDGLKPGNADKFITPDLGTGRMVEVIDSEEPAIMVCHWPGIYYNGEKIGFNIFKKVVNRLEQKYGSKLIWMKLTEISRYWAAKEFVKFRAIKNGFEINAPFATKNFTISINQKVKVMEYQKDGRNIPLAQQRSISNLSENTFVRDEDDTIICFNLTEGKSELIVG